MLLKIKEFSDFCGISVRTLQLYDRLDLFKPASIGEDNGYRYYDTEQMRELNTIISFKSVGFTLKEISLLKANRGSKEYIVNALTKKREENYKKIAVLEYDNENIDSMIEAIEQKTRPLTEEEEAVHMSKIACLDNEKLEQDFSSIIWL